MSVKLQIESFYLAPVNYQHCKSTNLNFLKVITSVFNINGSFNYVLSCWFPVTSSCTQTFKTWIIHHNDHNVSFNVRQSHIIVKLQVSDSSQMDPKSTLQQGFPIMRNAPGERACKNTGEGFLVFCMYFSLLLISDLKCLQQPYIFR